MDEKTVIAPSRSTAKAKAAADPKRKPAGPSNPAPAATSPDDRTVIAPSRFKSKPKSTPEPKKPAESPKEAVPAAKAAKSKPSAIPLLIFSFLALSMLGVAASLITIYILTGGKSEFTEKELEAELAPVAEEQNEDEDAALTAAVIEPKIIELSGDPVIVNRRYRVSRQLTRLGGKDVTAAATKLGVKGEVFRMSDMLDVPEANLSGGTLGEQQDFAFFQNASLSPQEQSESNGDRSQDLTDIGNGTADEEGTSILLVQPLDGRPSRPETAEEVKKSTTLSQALVDWGFDQAASKEAETAFAKFYGLKALAKGDQVAARGLYPAEGNSLVPMQISVYRNSDLVGTVAMSELNTYAKGEDPWYMQDIFAAPLLPDNSEISKVRLLDAIYAAALRNDLPTSVAGETILLLSRSHDLEQPIAQGDNITLVYSTAVRDPKTGFGRVLFVKIGRTSGNIECYVFQPKPGVQFDCVNVAGNSSVDEAGMVMPVNGIIVGKYGPRTDPNTGEKKMNFGVDWTAPKGSPVVAAYTGKITSAGQEKDMGNVVRIAHDDGSSTVYAYLQRFAPGIATGVQVSAGQTIGIIGTSPASREPRLHFELLRGGEPVDPVAEFQTKVEKGGAVDQFVQRIIYIESGNRCNARNPLSTAVGLGQFIESTWMTTIRLHRPDLLQGRTRAQVLALRTDCNLARAMTTAFTRDNAAVIRSRGHPITPGNLYLAHFLGVGGALKALGGNRNALISDVFGEHHVRANPFERGKSVGWLIGWAAQKMTGKTPKLVAQNSSKNTPQPPNVQGSSQPSGTASDAPMVRYADNSAFTELKRAVEVMLR